MILGAMSGTYKEAGPGAIDLHADYLLVRESYPEFALIAVACWALEDWSEEAGPTWVIPGSHRHRRAPRRGESREGAVPVLMPKGSIALWSHGVWHWQGERALPEGVPGSLDAPFHNGADPQLLTNCGEVGLLLLHELGRGPCWNP